ncbi:hypothetical protein HGRIS_002600 [Hohenbuehelia grisea]|uniref:Major facilitator superfamily (MFS) profile domain-containing protein n=1 Tax=Hohenbuehelia grisea TaxID=104357 RepID=A0ABR3JLP7_9AGAR
MASSISGCEKRASFDGDAESLTKSSTPKHDNKQASEFERKTIRQVDWRMLPLLALLYAVALIDRTNTGIARVAGMGAALKLSVGERYSIISCIYFVPYTLLQLPGNLVLRWVGAREWVTFLVISWGAVELGMGFAQNWHVLALCRALLGVFESGFFPAMVFIITTWYRRFEVQKRLAIFYLFSIFIGGFSSIFAYVLTLLKGRGGLQGWQWIFIIEGIITIALGIIGWFFIVDFPDKNRFLTKEQTELILARVEADRGDSVPDEVTFRKVVKHLCDWTIWANGLMFMCTAMPSYAVGYFITIILSGMGWGITDSLLLTAPPYVFAAIITYIFAHYSDSTGMRAPFIVAQALLTMLGCLLTLYVSQDGVRYFGLFLTCGGAAASVPGVLAYGSNNVREHSKRAVSTAVTVAMGGIGGIFATTVFREQDAPMYLPGMWATIGCQLFMIALVGCTTFTFMKRNKERREGKVETLEGASDFYYTL